MTSQPPQKQPQKKCRIGRPRKYPKSPHLDCHGTQRQKNTPPSISEGNVATSLPPLGRPRKVVIPPDTATEENLAEPITSTSTLNYESSREHPTQIVRHIPEPIRGTFSELSEQEPMGVLFLQSERNDGEPEDSVSITDSDEEIDDSTDVEEGGFEGAEERRRTAASEEENIGSFAEDHPHVRTVMEYTVGIWAELQAEAKTQSNLG